MKVRIQIDLELQTADEKEIPETERDDVEDALDRCVRTAFDNGALVPDWLYATQWDFSTPHIPNTLRCNTCGDEPTGAKEGEVCGRQMEEDSPIEIVCAGIYRRKE